MTRKEFDNNWPLLVNPGCVAWMAWDTNTRSLLSQVPVDQVQILHFTGDWVTQEWALFCPGRAYRLNPTWAGPAEPPKPPKPPKTKFVDVKPYLDGDGDWMVKHPHSPRTPERFLARLAIGDSCIGFVYGEEVSDRLHHDDFFNDGLLTGYRLRIPDFVRFEV